MALEPNTTVSHYKILSEIGKGGMGEVYLAQDTKLDRRVALKILPAEFAGDSERMARFVREAKSASALNHPNIITIYEIDESNGTRFIATEFIDGETLSRYPQQKRLSLQQAVEIAIQVASALDEAHSAGIVHRDIKPENIMVRENGLVKILDFGIAKLSEAHSATDTATTDPEAATAIQSGTTPGMIIGTANYMSPEQARGREVDARTDIFSFGVVLYEMLSGEQPFAGDTVSDTLAAVLMKEPKRLESIPPTLEAIVSETLQKDRNERYKSAKELLDDLKEFKQELEIQKHLERASSPNSQDQQTRILPTPTTQAGESPSSSTGSEEGFRVVVLPFKFRGANAVLESLAEGLSEEIVTGLSRFPYLRIITRSAALKGEVVTDERRTTSEQFGARYVLEGSLRQVGTTVRVAVQLVDTTTGEHPWAETYDRKLDAERIFEIQDELVSRVVSTIADWHGVLVHSMAGSLRTKDKKKITPDEAVLYVFGYIERLSPEEHLAARDLVERIVEEFPDKGNCWAMLAILYCNEHMYGFNLRPDPLGRALTAAQRAVELEPANYLASQSLAFAYFFRREFAAFETMATKTLALNRMCGGTVAILGVFFACSGEWERGCRLSREAMELNPHFPGWYRLPFIFNAYRLKNYREALDEAQNINIPNYFWTLVMKAAALGQLGETEEAKKALNELLASRPDIAGKEPEEFGHWLDAEFVEDLMEGLRKAGFETISAEDQKEQKTQPKLTPTPETRETIGSESSETYSEQAFRVAVLPFIFRGTSDELETFAASLSEEIVTGLSRFSYLRIIAHGSTLGYKSEGGDVQEASEVLGVRYVIEGSLRQVGRTIRLAVKLVDTTTGEHLWAETYDRDFSAEAVFELQDELIPQIVSTVADWYGVLPNSMSEAVRLKSSEELNSYEAVLRSFGYFERISPEEHSTVRNALERAVEQVPGNTDAWAMLSMIYGEEHRFGFNEKPDSLERSLEAAKKAVDAAHSNHFAWLAMAQALFFRKEFDSFRDAAERVVSLNSLDGASIEYVGHLIAFSGDWERGCKLSERARLLNPNHPGWYWSVFFLDAYRRKDYENARNFLLKAALRGGGAYIYEQVLLASLYGQLEDTQSAQATLKKIEKMNPGYLLTVEREFAKWYLPELVEKLMHGLRKAGLEITSKTDQKEQKTQILEAKTSDTKTKDTSEKAEINTAILQPDTAEENAEIEANSKLTTDPKSNIQNPKSKWWLFGLLGLIFLTIGYFGYNYLASGSKQIESIAVMPFVNENGNEDVEYLSDGMTETLISSLSNLPNLNVKARSSVFRYKGKNTDAKTIGKELNVQAILNGRIVQRGEQLTLNLELVDAQTENLIWSDRYDRKQSDLVTLQSEIARDVSTKLKDKLSGAEEKKVTNVYTTNSEAYQLYLKGNFYTTKLTKEGFRKGNEYFERAIQLDPEYALAYNGIAHNQLTAMDWFSAPKVAGPKAKNAVEKAFALNDKLAETHLLRGMVAHWVEWDWATAESSFKQAIELDPSGYRQRGLYAWLLANLGRNEEAVASAAKGQQLDPISAEANWYLGMALIAAGRTDEAIARLQNAIELEPSYFYAHTFLGRAYLQAGKKQEALKSFERAYELESENSENLANLAYAQGVTGNKVEALKTIERLQKKSKNEYVAPYYIAIAYAGLGENEEVFKWLERAYEDKSDSLILYLTADPQMDEIRSDPRYKALLKRIKLPE